MGDLKKRFIETKVFLQNDALIEMGFKSSQLEYESVPFVFDIENIWAYALNEEDSIDTKGKTQIHLKSGDAIIIDIYFPRFDKMFKEYHSIE